MRNVTITLDDQLYELAKSTPEVQNSSLSAFVATLLRERLLSSPEQLAERTLLAIEAASKKATTPLDWNRDDIYER